MRAIEIAKSYGSVPKIKKLGRADWDILQIGLAPHPEILKAKIKYRFIKDLDKIIAEVKKLRKNGVTWERLKELGLYYANVALYLEKKITKNEMIEKIGSALWQYAKRQKTWFQRDPRIRWFDPNKKSDLKKIDSIARKFLK